MARQSDIVRQLIDGLSGSDSSAVDELFPLLYEELHRLAQRHMEKERCGHTLQATALVHEAWLSLMAGSQQPTKHQTREHFMAQASVAMRHILINRAKAKNADKRGSGWNQIQVDEIVEEFEGRSIDLLALNDALERLRVMDERQSLLVEMRFFGGMTMEQCAAVLEISERTAYQEWAHARAWLRLKLEEL